MDKMKKILIIELFLLLFTIAAIFIVNLYVSKKHSNEVYTENIGNDVNTARHNQDRIVKLNGENSEKQTSPERKPVINSDCLPSKYNFKWDVLKDNKPIGQAAGISSLAFDEPSKYSEAAGVTCFRGNNYRNSASYGYADIKDKKLVKVWSSQISYIDTWTGVGWTGQPAIVKWDPGLVRIMNITAEKKNKTNLKEVIYATLDGNIYFLDLDDGKQTRAPISTGAPHKGSISVDPRGLPLLYAGQGIDEVQGEKVDIGYRIFDLINQKLLLFINGLDPVSYRGWGAFDSNALVDKKTDTLVECGENGILYNIKLNTNFDLAKGSISIKPEILKYRYLSPFSDKIGTENSVAVYKNLAFFADNGGMLQCVDLNNMSPVWIRNVTDDTDSTITIDESDSSNVFLFTANEVDLRGKNDLSYIRKINALTGDLVWERSIECIYNESVNGGVLSTPIVGKNDIEDLVIFNIAKTGKENGGKLIAFSKKSGEEMWVINLDNYSWSSPVDVYTKDGKSYIIACDASGFMYLIEGKSGRILDKISLEANIEGSPAVFDNMLVVGTRGQKIWGIMLK